MIFSSPFAPSKLLDMNGNTIAVARVPTTPYQPRIIMWSNRYFLRHLEATYYTEVRCYLVPVGDMYTNVPGGELPQAAEPQK